MFPTQVRFAYKHYPLPMHKDSPLAHEAALAAGDQVKFWEMQELLFAKRAGTDGQPAAQRAASVARYASARFRFSIASSISAGFL
jgi:protein-disulfide isomerase